MLRAEDGIIHNESANDQEAKPDGDLVGHSGPERKCPPR